MFIIPGVQNEKFLLDKQTLILSRYIGLLRTIVRLESFRICLYHLHSKHPRRVKPLLWLSSKIECWFHFRSKRVDYLSTFPKSVVQYPFGSGSVSAYWQDLNLLPIAFDCNWLFQADFHDVSVEKKYRTSQMEQKYRQIDTWKVHKVDQILFRTCEIFDLLLNFESAMAKGVILFVSSPTSFGLPALENLE